LKVKKFLKLALILVFLISIFSISQSVWNSYSKLGTLKGSETEIARLKAENKKLEEEKKFRQSDFYVEKQAREKLGLAREGEVVYLDEKSASSSSQAAEEEKIANWLSWVKLFTE